MSAAEIADAVLELKGLVHVRAILEGRGATEAELAEHTAAIDRVRDRLAELARADELPAAA